MGNNVNSLIVFYSEMCSFFIIIISSTHSLAILIVSMILCCGVMLPVCCSAIHNSLYAYCYSAQLAQIVRHYSRNSSIT